MCGIVYARDFRPGTQVSPRIIDMYIAQKKRGTQGYGFYQPQENVLYHNTAEGPTLRRLKRTKTQEILFHHRMPSSTPNLRNSCHPFSTRQNDKLFKSRYIFVHNGVINNDHLLRADHKSKFGIEYTSETISTYTTTPVTKWNDSEALMYDVVLYLEEKIDKPEARGSNAFICIETSKRNTSKKLWFYRNDSNPLRIEWKVGKKLTIRSEGKGEMIEPDILYCYDYKTDKISRSKLEMVPRYTPQAWKPEAKEKSSSATTFHASSKRGRRELPAPDFTYAHHLLPESISGSNMGSDYSQDSLLATTTPDQKLQPLSRLAKDNIEKIGVARGEMVLEKHKYSFVLALGEIQDSSLEVVGKMNGLLGAASSSLEAGWEERLQLLMDQHQILQSAYDSVAFQRDEWAAVEALQAEEDKLIVETIE